MTNGTQPKEQKRRRGILTVSGFAHFVHDGFTDTIYVLLPLWASGFGLSHAQVGLLKACMSVGLAGLQVPAGYLAERYGERTILILGTALTGLAFLSMALATGIMGLAVLLFIAGIGASTQHPLASALVSKGFENNRRRACCPVTLEAKTPQSQPFCCCGTSSGPGVSSSHSDGGGSSAGAPSSVTPRYHSPPLERRPAMNFCR